MPLIELRELLDLIEKMQPGYLLTPHGKAMKAFLEDSWHLMTQAILEQLMPELIRIEVQSLCKERTV